MARFATDGQTKAVMLALRDGEFCVLCGVPIAKDIASDACDRCNDAISEVEAQVAEAGLDDKATEKALALIAQSLLQ